jgi:hypothetical protein
MFRTFFLDPLRTLNSLRTQNLTSLLFCLVDELDYGINRGLEAFETENDPYCIKGGSEHMLTLTCC